MLNAFYSWTDAYIVLRTEAFDRRGVDARLGASCPRTTNGDALAIAAVFDPYLRTHARAGLARRWCDVRAELARAVLAHPAESFASNVVFWSTLEAAVVVLDDRASELPDPTMWNGLVAHLHAPLPRRNIGPSGDGPFQHFDAKTFDDLYLAQYQYLREQRGFDIMPAEAGTTGFPKPIPRTTNADVVLLADYWSGQLASVKKVMGSDGIEKRWKDTVAEVDASARAGDPHAVYAHNNAFWRVLGTTTTHIGAAAEAPTKASIALDSVVHSLEHLPGNVVDAVSGAVDAVGSVGGAAASGLLGAFKTPLLVGGGLLALYLIVRKD